MKVSHHAFFCIQIWKYEFYICHIGCMKVSALGDPFDWLGFLLRDFWVCLPSTIEEVAIEFSMILSEWNLTGM